MDFKSDFKKDIVFSLTTKKALFYIKQKYERTFHVLYISCALSEKPSVIFRLNQLPVCKRYRRYRAGIGVLQTVFS